MLNRRHFFMQTVRGTILFVPAFTAHPTGDSPRGRGLSPQQGTHLAQTAGQAPPRRPPALAADLVRDFVQKAHADLPGTKNLLAEQPALLNATWDWGGGDFETAIGGAGHMGHRAIAEFLISQGARFDIFVAAMLGTIDYVRAALTAWPDLMHSKGPHGISLLRHARAGGEPAAGVVEYLLSKGAA